VNRRLGLVGTVALGLVLALAGPAAAAAETIYVPDDFNPSRSDTRATGHFDVQGTGLHIWTEGSTSTDKVAEYVDTDELLADVGEPTLDYTNTTRGGVPGFQLVVDFGGDEDTDSTSDGILIGEPGVYGIDWWLNNAAEPFVQAGAPSHSGGSGSANHGTLDQWRTAFPDAEVVAFGFSLGSGVKGDGVLNAITFAQHVVLESKDKCKKGGWETSTKPVFRNQGDCVSSFAKK
jgi:hypothetical protein